MAKYPNYPKVDFSTSQNFLARDPAGSGQVVRVQGQKILDAAVQEILNRGDIVQAVDTLTEAKANDYESGIYVLTGGNTVTLDGGQAIYRVSDPGSGGIVMDNGNELVLLFVANTPANIITPFDSIADLPEVNADYRVSVTGYHPSTTVGGGEFVGNASARHDGIRFIDPDRTFPTPAEWAAGLSDPAVIAWFADSGSDVPCWELVRGEIIYDLTVQIPSDFATLQDAIDDLDGRIEPVGSVYITLNIESGHALTAGLNLRHKDFSKFRITSDDATVSLSGSFVGADTTGVDAGILGETPAAPLCLIAYNAIGPIWDCIVDMGNSYGTGLQLAEGEITVTIGNGVINAGFRGIQVHGRANIYGATFNGASGTGIRLQQASSCNARNATADNCCQTADLTNSAVYVSRSSILEFRGGSAQNSGASGLIARRSKVTADDANFDGAADKGIECENCSEVSFSNGFARNTVSTSLRCIANGSLYAVGAETSTTSSAKNLDVDVGGVITVAGGNLIEGLPATEAQVLAESTVNYLGAYDPRGMIFYDAGNGTFKITSNANGISQRFSDGRMITFVSGTIDTGTIAAGNFSAQLTMPTQPDTFITVDTSHMDVVGRTSSGGGGNRVAADNYIRPGVISGNEWRVRNTGQQLDGASTGLNMLSINYTMTTFGTWY